jgi:transposase
MEDKEFFDRALELQAPWVVRGVKLDLESKKVELEIGVEKGWRWKDSSGQAAQVHGWEERQWRHLNTMQFETTIRARVPRLKRADGSTEVASVPWAERYARWTLDFEDHAVRVIGACASLAAAADLLGLDWSSLRRIMQRAVERGMARRDWARMDYIGLDEKSFGRGQSYVTIGSDLQRGVVFEVAEGRHTEAARTVLGALPVRKRAAGKAAAADMSPAIATAVHREMPQAELVHDKFHVSKLLGEVVDKVRRAEAKKLAAEGDDSLKNTRFWWLYGQDKLPHKHAVSFEQLAQSNLKTSRAWMAKENFAGFWMQEDRGEGMRFFDAWFGSARRSKLAPLKQVALTLKDHLRGLLAYFTHPITNAVAEGLNSKIQALKHAARGFRSFASYRIRILFHCGGLDLRPRLSHC